MVGCCSFVFASRFEYLSLASYVEVHRSNFAPHMLYQTSPVMRNEHLNISLDAFARRRPHPSVAFDLFAVCTPERDHLQPASSSLLLWWLCLGEVVAIYVDDVV